MSSATVRRRRAGEIRVRSGCWTCRDRRVKCNEKRPACGHCERLGLFCSYGVRLTWPSAIPNHGTAEATCPYDLHIESWMFLNVTFDDVSESTVPYVNTDPQASSKNTLLRPPRDRSGLEPIWTTSPFASMCQTSRISRVPSTCLAGLDEEECLLWDYFHSFIAPRCALNSSNNPYRDIILRHAADSPSGPVFHCVMAAATIQMQILGHGEPKSKIWTRRSKALSELRAEVSRYEDHEERGCDRRRSSAQIIAASLMMCFFEILHDCSPSWEIHAKFAKSFLLSERAAVQTHVSEHSRLSKFAAAYFTVHDVFANTVCAQEQSWDLPFSLHNDTESMDTYTLTGCSKELIGLLAKTSRLAAACNWIGAPQNLDTGTVSTTGSGNNDHLPADARAQRDTIERELYELDQLPLKHQCSTYSILAEDELGSIEKTKRLATLLYLYTRVDRWCHPGQPHIVRLTDQIMALIPKVSLRTNTILWPLFMVATLGIRPESDFDRLLVLSKLDALQQNRQLGNVRKARHIIEKVWSARELRSSDALQGWSILMGRVDALSLA
ncbi:fungal-specific transcription factor domain-containing protein [Xylariaceae sp. FL1019]|nr:fungal-specific transcription factor domain-containing protein [Xylariaceae sp. FL1019]